MPNIYQGCQIEDDISEALQEIRGTFAKYDKATKEALEELSASLAELSGTPDTASVVIGSTTDNQVFWSAVESGSSGNEISIVYQYRGAFYNPSTSTYEARPPSAETIGKTVYLNLAIDDKGNIDPAYDVATSLPIWLAGTGVSDLVTASLVGAGTDLPEASTLTRLTGGKDRPLTDAENAAKDIAKEFGYNSYQSMMRALDVPIIENEADALQYLSDVDDDYIIINKKLFIVEGTNLVGLRALYNSVGGDIPQFKRTLELMRANINIPYVVLTQTIESVVYELICNEQQPTTTLSEKYRDLNRSLQVIADQYASGDLSAINSYVFWVVEPNSSRANYLKLSSYGYPDDYITGILVGETPTILDTSSVSAPLVATVEDPTLLDSFNFTDAEIDELMAASAEGIRPPKESDPNDKLEVINKLLVKQPRKLANGLSSRVKKPLAAMQAIDMSKTTGDKNLSKELATRGKACARLSTNLNLDAKIPKLPEIPGIPDLPTADLDQAAKKIEASFAALSNMIESASKLFDSQINGLLDTAKSIVNKLQNLLSLTDNLLNNDLAKCILGTGTKTTGTPELPSPGGNPLGAGSVDTGGFGTGTGSLGSGGGLPLPTSLLGDALKKLSVSMDETITDSVEGVMKLVSIPLCIVQTMLESLNGFDLGGAINPCKDGGNSDDKCPPPDVQDIINSSETLTTAMNKLPQTATANTEAVTKETTEEVEKFTGLVNKTVTDVSHDITRGVQEVMDDLQKSINSKVEMVDKFSKAIKELTGDSEELANDADAAEKESSENNGGCFSPSLGLFTDSIENFI